MHTDVKRDHVLVNVYDHVNANVVMLFQASLRTSRQTSQRPWTWRVLTSFCLPCTPLPCTSEWIHRCRNHCIITEVPM